MKRAILISIVSGHSAVLYLDFTHLLESNRKMVRKALRRVSHIFHVLIKCVRINIDDRISRKEKRDEKAS